jgi:hypothetical protein
MCRRAVCRSCSKPSFIGCGRHVERVLADVPPLERCQCPNAPGIRASIRPLLLAWLFGKRT